MDADSLINQVHDEKSFLTFVKALLQDRMHEVRLQKSQAIDSFGRGPNGWENHSIEAFLEAAIAWREATNIGESQGLSNESVWKRVAVFLYLGKIYE